ncbi:histidine--tRNA ligase [Deinococcus roseus]|uniref:Histidine--tRNA ligase n=1 Tax=Deinococcus roseus TaxID=392414 RepID=A0ABQ2D0U9_9DEIO|nr:histidine--tRNA ligase [Deinococcus roseus]GGJ32633.1 histidine--tRNA ligase [Deinococcus roseus]
MSGILRPKGTQDLLPDGSPQLKAEFSARGHRHLVELAAQVLENAGASYIQTPMFEMVEVIKRGVGDSTDIVRKEMFTARAQGDEFILRPEGTAPIVRAFVQNGLKQLPTPAKLWTFGAMFRAERPQKGRYRQFHQLDYEVLGSDDPLIDAEAIALMMQVIGQLGVKNIELKLGSVGDPEDRVQYNQYLRDLFSPFEEKLSEDSKARLILNPMRILDSKSPGDQDLISELQPKMMLDFLGEAAASHFKKVCEYLTVWEVPYTIDPSIVRGLDYYRRTAWEIHHEGVGAKSALGGGGRYDGLAELLGGPHTPGIGWAFGIERLLIAMDTEGVKLPEPEGLLLYVGALEDSTLPLAAKLAFAARTKGKAEFSYKPKAPGKQIQDALKKNARFVALIGSSEAETGVVTLKNLQSGEQSTVSQDDLLNYL